MSKKNIEEIGKGVVETEALALSKLAANLPRDFSRTIEAVLKTRGRVIVSGIGKSGHVGRKIAATDLFFTSNVYQYRAKKHPFVSKKL